MVPSQKKKTTYVKQLRGNVPGAYITLSTKGTDGYGILVQSWQIVAETPIHITDSMKSGRKQSAEQRNKRACQQSLKRTIVLL